MIFEGLMETDKQYTKIQKIFEELYGYKFDFSSSPKKRLREAYRDIRNQREELKKHSSFNKYINDPQYSKYTLALEALNYAIKDQHKEQAMTENRKKKTKKVNESQNNKVGFLLENEMEKAEVVLAAQGISDELKSMVEKLAKLPVDDVMPLIERMREVYGSEEAERFEQEVERALESAKEAVESSKEVIDKQANILSGDEPATDSEMEPTGTEFGDQGGEKMGQEGDQLDMDDEDAEEPAANDEVEGAEPAAGGNEPLGRAKRESKQSRKKPMNEEVQKGDTVEITGGDHKGHTGKVKKADVRGPNSLVTVNGDDEYIPTKHLKKATGENVSESRKRKALERRIKVLENQLKSAKNENRGSPKRTRK